MQSGADTGKESPAKLRQPNNNFAYPVTLAHKVKGVLGLV
jgi:hypothetical protein